MNNTLSISNKLSYNEVKELALFPLEELSKKARDITENIHGKKILLRGLIEFSNYCSADCLYCGIRRSNKNADRYRLTENDILEAVKKGYSQGLKTFVFQSGEDKIFTTPKLCVLISKIKELTNNEAAITLSCGIRSKTDYKEFFDAGADRYLLRFETSDPELHKYLRNGIKLEKRLKALHDLKEVGFQLGSGFMVGLPGETEETLIKNIMLSMELEMDMGGIGPFIPHSDTPLANSQQQPIELSIRATALLRIALPYSHIPATTAAGSLDPLGREKMISAGANVLMPNITPVDYKKFYLLYPGKICLDESGIECIGCLSGRVKPLDRELSFERGDALRVQI